MNLLKTIPLSRSQVFSLLFGFICVYLGLISGASAAPLLLPQGLADPSGRIGFFASADGGIECIDLAGGKVLWQTHEAQRPLLLDGDHLLAQAGTKRNRLRILRLDVKRNGECDFESDPLVFPAWVVTGESPGHSFAAQWHLDKHHLVLHWQASARYAGPSRPTPEEESAARKHDRGIAHIDLRTGQIEVLPAHGEHPAANAAGSPGKGEPAALAAGCPPSAAGSSPSAAASSPPPLPEQLERKALRWQRLIGQHWKVLTLEEEKGQQCFVLHSWDRQKNTEQKPKELLRGKRLLARTTLDEQILCLREASPSPDEGLSLSSKKAPSWWWLFSVETGKLLGRIPDEAGMHAIAVVGKHVFYLVPGTLRGSLDRPNVQPLTLHAVDLSSGKKLWQRPVAGKWIDPPPPF